MPEIIHDDRGDLCVLKNTTHNHSSRTHFTHPSFSRLTAMMEMDLVCGV